MPVIGFHAQHEQAHPRDLRDSAVRAEEAGFDAVMCSDHLAPWSSSQGHSGYTWSWLGAALQATQRVPMGAFHAPGQRYHPVISAQAMATLGAMFPGRFPWVAVGSGEALNEHVTGDPWPAKDVRMARLRECVEVMRALWRGEEVSHRGLVVVDRARLWSLPDEPPKLVAGAISPQTAAWAAGWADGLITVNQSPELLRGMVDAYRGAGGRGGLHLQVHLSWARDDDTALAVACDKWRSNCLPTSLAWELDTPEQFEAATRFVPPEEVARNVLVSSDPGLLAARLREYQELGFDELYLHPVGEDDEFIDVFGAKVLPQLSSP
ncbi:MAG TPA: TIGR03885 family FMN-dependent LLM class oxidoreductase [Mycobacteriales bacterium]